MRCTVEQGLFLWYYLIYTMKGMILMSEKFLQVPLDEVAALVITCGKCGYKHQIRVGNVAHLDPTRRGDYPYRSTCPHCNAAYINHGLTKVEEIQRLFQMIIADHKDILKVEDGEKASLTFEIPLSE